MFSVAFSDTPDPEIMDLFSMGMQLGYFHRTTIGNKDGPKGLQPVTLGQAADMIVEDLVDCLHCVENAEAERNEASLVSAALDQDLGLEHVDALRGLPAQTSILPGPGGIANAARASSRLGRRR